MNTLIHAATVGQAVDDAFERIRLVKTDIRIAGPVLQSNNQTANGGYAGEITSFLLVRIYRVIFLCRDELIIEIKVIKLPFDQLV